MRTFIALLFLTSLSAQAQILTNKLDIGDGTNGDKLIRARTAAPVAGRPAIKWNQTDSKWQTSSDGVTYNDIGSNGGPIVTISASNIDWAAGSVFTKLLSANTTFTFSNLVVGKTIIVRVTNTASNYTVDWPASVEWAANTAPTQTTGVKSDVYTFVNYGDYIHGSVVQDFSL